MVQRLEVQSLKERKEALEGIQLTLSFVTKVQRGETFIDGGTANLCHRCQEHLEPGILSQADMGQDTMCLQAGEIS